MTGKLCFVACLVLWLPMAHGADVYKWKDTDGTIRYTDAPPRGKIPYQTISRKKPPAPAPEAAPAEEEGEATDAAAAPAAAGEADASAAPEAAPAPAPAAGNKTKPASPDKAGSAEDKEVEAAKKKIADAEAKKKKAQEEEDRKLREKNCSAAKSNLLQLKQGGRIYSTNEKGEREYLSDADYDSNVAQAQKDVDQWCGSQ